MKKLNKVLVIIIGITILFGTLTAQVTEIVNGYKIDKGERPVIDLSKVPAEVFESRKISIKLSPDMENILKDNYIITGSRGAYVKTGVASLDEFNTKYKAIKYKPVIFGLYDASPSSVKYRERHKAWGFHLWMEITFEEGIDVIEAVKQYGALKEVQFAEPVYKKELNELLSLKPGSGKVENNQKWIPNDTRFNEQWHYNNTGQQSGTADCDIDLPEAWEIEKGNSDVIICVEDGGIQIDHPDISGNMWSGIGYNFVTGSSTIEPHYHGTHVAGTISGVNNNGIGISGIAGGSGTGDGVRLMSCQVFTDYDADGFSIAPVYAADNGAAISQNSWGYTSAGYYEQSVLDAIDYFNANGGGNVMYGGLTIYSAGNTGTGGQNYPACYSGTLAVAATNNNDLKTWYSSYDTWVDVSAPGGETDNVLAQGVLSTYTSGAYQFLQGTSMACPHTSGVAALILSLAPGLFSAQEVKDIIRNTTDNIDGLNTTYAGKLGTGRINANNALLEVLSMITVGGIFDISANTIPFGNVTSGRILNEQFIISNSHATEYLRGTITTINGYSVSVSSKGENEFSKAKTVVNYAIAPNSSKIFNLRFAPVTEGNYNGNIIITSSDVNHPESYISVSGTCLVPEINLNTETLSANVSPGASTVKNFSISNSGTGELDYSISVNYLNGKELKGNGGPDGYGYRWKDSDEPDGPVYDWVDISSTGTELPFYDDETTSVIDLGFTFNYYGTDFAGVRICSNGFLSFTSTYTSYYNTSIPVSDQPNDMIALLWDDLYYYSGSSAMYYSDTANERFIVSYIGVISSSGVNNFQVILYKTGKIVYQYQTVDAVTALHCTVGIENGDGTAGSLVTYNSSYLKNNLAIEFISTVEWLSFDKTSGTVLNGGTDEITATFNAGELEEGFYYADILINSNDPDETTKIIPVTFTVAMNVGGTFSISEGSMSYGNVTTGKDSVKTFQISNSHESETIAGYITTSDGYSISVAGKNGKEELKNSISYFVGPDYTKTFNLVFSPVSESDYNGNVTVTSSDTNHPVAVIQVSGCGVTPDINVPDSISANTSPGASAVKSFNISNSGIGELDYSISVNYLNGKELKGSGGPDGFGYKWKDSDELDGPVYDWVDISASGTELSFYDDEISPVIDLGFTFNFYGTDFTGARICSNGFLSFTSTSSSYSNTAIPSSAQPNNLIALLWDDLYYTGDGAAIYFKDTANERFIVSYIGVNSSSGANTFQVILYKTGKIVYQYQMVDAVTTLYCTVGIENGDGSVGSLVSYNSSYLKNNLAIEFIPTVEWLSFDKTSGTVLNGGTDEITATFNAGELEEGFYYADILINSNDPDETTKTIPVTLTVALSIGGIFSITTDSISFGNINIGTDSIKTFQITNSHESETIVGSITTINGFTVSAAAKVGNETPKNSLAFLVGPNITKTYNLTFSPDSLVDYYGNITVTSSDPNHQTVDIAVIGRGVAPNINVPVGISSNATPGSYGVSKFNITNTGLGKLNYSTSISYLPDKDFKGSGGPDAYGYKWKDTDDPDGPDCNWIDISSTGTAVTLGNDAISSNITIGFPFNFYGNEFTALKICSNGFLTFTSTSTAYSNSTIPSALEPNNTIALLWDDLAPNQAGSIRYFNDAEHERFIVSYSEVPHNNAGDCNTAQVILYKTGKIVYQYLSVGANTTNSCTVGIENAYGSAGTQIVYNTEYLRDNFAIQFVPQTNWLSFDKPEGSVTALSSEQITATFDAADLEPGIFTAGITITSNDPDEPETVMTATLNIDQIYGGYLLVPVKSISFGILGIGESLSKSISIVNKHNSETMSGSITTVNGYTASILTKDSKEENIENIRNFVIAPNTSKTFNILFKPTALGSYNGNIIVNSSDWEHPAASIMVRGCCVSPDLNVDSSGVMASIFQGGSVSKNFNIGNKGPVKLNYSITKSYGYGKDVKGNGGPDGGGYIWKDSDDPYGPVYSWIDIAHVGTYVPLSLSDMSSPIDLGFTFKFYGNDFTEVRICSNGVLTFSSGNALSINQTIPSTSEPNNLLAVLWDYLDPRPGYICYYNDISNDRFIVSYAYVPHYNNNNGFNTFQVILYKSGKIVYQYKAIAEYTQNACTVGIENENGTVGTQIEYNYSRYLKPNYAIQFSMPPDWLALDVTTGTVFPSDSVQITATFNAGILDRGFYSAELTINSNDANDPALVIPILFTVTEAVPANITLSTASISKTAAPGTSVQDSFDLINTGEVALNYRMTSFYSDTSPIDTSDVILIHSNDFTNSLNWTKNVGHECLWVQTSSYNGGNVSGSPFAIVTCLESDTYTGTLTSPTIDLSGCDGNVTISFEQYKSSNSGGSCLLQASADGTNFSTISINNSATGIWGSPGVPAVKRINIPANFLTATAKFRFAASLKIGQGFWAIDNIRIEKQNPIPWLTISGEFSGTLTNSESRTFNLSCNTARLSEGTYNADIIIVSNDNDEPLKTLPVEFIVATPVSAPANIIVVSANATQINLGWDAVNGATSYKIYRSSDPYTGFTQISESSTNSYQDNNVLTGNKYFYYASAVRE